MKKKVAMLVMVVMFLTVFLWKSDSANIAAGQTVVIGFNGEHGDVNQVPTGCMLSSYSKSKE